MLQPTITLCCRSTHQRQARSTWPSLWLPVIILSMGLNAAVAGEKPSAHGGFNNQQGQSVLNLFQPSDDNISKPIGYNESLDKSHADDFQYEFSPTEESEAIERILLDHYQAAASDPAHVRADLVQISRYLSQYPEAVSLITSLADKHWQLSHADNTFETEVRGNALQVHTVTIKFDSRTAAKLRSHAAVKPGPMPVSLHRLTPCYMNYYMRIAHCCKQKHLLRKAVWVAHYTLTLMSTRSSKRKINCIGP